MAKMEDRIAHDGFSLDLLKHQFEALRQMRCKQELCDVTVIVNHTHTIYAHRVLLAAYSSYFFAMFNTDMVESRLGVLHIDDIQPNLMDQLIDLAYGIDLHIDDDNVADMLSACHRLQISTGINRCCDYLILSLHPSNCLGILKFARINQCQIVIDAASKYCWHHFTAICDEEEFTLLSLDEVQEYFSNDHLHVKEEAEVLRSAVIWLLHDWQQRHPSLSAVMDCIRFSYISKEEIVSIARKNCPADIFQCIADYLSDKSNRKKRKPGQRHYSSAVFIIGSTSLANCCRRYNICSRTWVKMPSLVEKKLNTLVGDIDGKLYAISSTPASDEITEIGQNLECYDPNQESWTIISALPSCRWQFSMACIDDRICFIGGYNFKNGFSHLATVDCYHPKLNQWTKLPDLPEKRRGSCTAFLQGILYVIGGHDGTRILSSCECYDMTQQCWLHINDMKVPRESHKAIVINKKIYVIGGISKSGYTKCVECYDPVTNSWQCCANAPVIYPRQQVVSLNNRLYLLNSDTESPVLCYNTMEDKWYKSRWPKFAEGYNGGTAISCASVDGL
ncbi:uncharacterized protein TRIADDRAFT_56004 [Trichoplax adhaerens]|uniref:BTB domain-containing protein n=1 Tax=Trichoplax adhaerens TaxID=10228 RepID=B3RTQ0_TRIAD|nr:hypothetical protein TRIADDRAFT_56004 [Trichoplax adhaerens]EDV25668.1 hypothetical protein TRIADDRAFT_56004 [Trichoplax adhaerens]|eukprot:XP_002111701.1 hypothetical protein TRIADDRAFT_56004 [Trichoplax adhaerens]